MKIYIDKSKVKEHENFIFYNHIFSRGKSKFTVQKLQEELKQYDLPLTLEDIQRKVDKYVEFGILDQHFSQYKIH